MRLSLESGQGLAASAALSAALLSAAGRGLPAERPPPFREDFARPDGLLASEYARWHPAERGAAESEDWEMGSGSLFVRGGTGWTGRPDDGTPDRLSADGNNSAVFRLTTKRADFRNVAVRFSVLNHRLVSTPSTPEVPWDGVHVWLRYQSPYRLYYASVHRRDGTVVIKKKVPGGPSNEGTYYPLTGYAPHKVPFGRWEEVTATVSDEPDGSVSIKLYLDGVLAASARDDGTVGGPPIRAAGRVGLRGDNCEFQFDDFSAVEM